MYQIKNTQKKLIYLQYKKPLEIAFQGFRILIFYLVCLIPQNPGLDIS